MSSFVESNWYVIQVFESHEEEIKNKCLDYISRDILSFAFVPRREKLVKHKKKWVTILETIFPSYIFLETDDIKALYIEIRKISDFKKFIGKDDDFIHPIYEFEKQSLLKYVDEEYIARLSKGLKDGDEIIIIEGPLVDNIGNIKRIDRKKRKAIVEVEIIGQIVEIELGLELITKSDNIED